jgi:hypothetical protein
VSPTPSRWAPYGKGCCPVPNFATPYDPHCKEFTPIKHDTFLYPLHHISKMFHHMLADQAGSYINALPHLLPLPKMSSRYWFRGAARELVEDRCSYPQGFKDGDVQHTPLNHMTWQEPMQNGHFHHTLAPPNRPRPPCSPSAQEQRAQVRVIMNDVLFKISKASTKADSPHPHHGEIPRVSWP